MFVPLFVPQSGLLYVFARSCTASPPVLQADPPTDAFSPRAGYGDLIAASMAELEATRPVLDRLVADLDTLLADRMAMRYFDETLALGARTVEDVTAMQPYNDTLLLTAWPSRPVQQIVQDTMTIGQDALAHDRDSFRRGTTAFRNARDRVKEQRDQAIRRTNERANTDE